MIRRSDDPGQRLAVLAARPVEHQGGDGVGQSGAGPRESGMQGVRLRAGDLAEALHVEVVLQGKSEDVPVGRIHRRHPLGHYSRRFVPAQAGIEVDAVIRHFDHLIGVAEPVASADRAQALVARDGVEPGPKLRRIPQLTDRTGGNQQGIVDDVLRSRGIPQHRQGVCVELRRVRVVHTREPLRRVARQVCCQLRIAAHGGNSRCLVESPHR